MTLRTLKWMSTIAIVVGILNLATRYARLTVSYIFIGVAIVLYVVYWLVYLGKVANFPKRSSFLLYCESLAKEINKYNASQIRTSMKHLVYRSIVKLVGLWAMLLAIICLSDYKAIALLLIYPIQHYENKMFLYLFNVRIHSEYSSKIKNSLVAIWAESR
ncbi:MAG: hypothetical protein U9N61_04040 [Euryarchaeota archaeon]|nr:hypothetical protein [Euryarchaeota archaeon]